MKRTSESRKLTALVCMTAFVICLSFASRIAYAQQGSGTMMAADMMGRGMMGGKGCGMMPMMGEQKHRNEHPSSTSLMKILHKWGKLFFVQQDELGLTEEQLDQIESILTSHVKSAIRKKADLKVLLIESQEVLVKEEINLKAVEKKLKAMEALNTEMVMEGVQTLKKALAILTPEQQKKIRRLFKNTTLMWGKKMGMMPGGMMGSGMMKGMMGQGGMMPGMMGQGAAASGEGKKKSEHEH